MRQKNKPLAQPPNQEDIYKLLAAENWPALLSFLWENPQVIATDAIIRHAIDTCESVFFAKLDTEADKEKLINTLESFYVLHTQKKYQLAGERFKLVTVELVRLWRDKNLEQAYHRARLFPTDELCQSVIKEYEDALPRQVAHTQTSLISVTENKNVADFDGRCTLFKSKQEKEFYEAVRDAFPMYIVYPNVAVSSILDFGLLKDRLTSAERTYFLQATVDCVVFDYHSEMYLPKYFYELDSVYHDWPGRKVKDGYKDNILAIAGQTLYRIRREGVTQGRGDFTKLIREITERGSA
jgi:very-short-patch-repair endonuclease